MRTMNKPKSQTQSAPITRPATAESITATEDVDTHRKAWNDMGEVCKEIGKKAAIAHNAKIMEVIAAVSPEDIAISGPTAIVVRADVPQPRVRTFVAKPCTHCKALRAQDPKVKPEDNFTRVFATRGNIRYCRCHYCGNTWKDTDA